MADQEQEFVSPPKGNEEEDEPKVVELDSSSEHSFKSFEGNEEEKESPADIKQKLTDEFTAAVGEEAKTSEEVPVAPSPCGDVSRAEEYKQKGNEMFKAQEYIEALDFYKQAIAYCPDDETEKLAIYYNNKGITLVQLGQKDDALTAFGEGIKYNEAYLKPRYQRMKLLKDMEKYSDAKDDAKFILEKDPNFPGVFGELKQLEKLEKEKLDKMKDEVLGNLKNLGNMVLGKFGMSLDNFKLNQNQDGTYNISMGN